MGCTAMDPMTIEGNSGSVSRDAQAVGHADDVGEAHLVGQPDVGAVERLGRGVQQGDDAAAVALVVAGRVGHQVMIGREVDGAGRLGRRACRRSSNPAAGRPAG